MKPNERYYNSKSWYDANSAYQTLKSLYNLFGKRIPEDETAVMKWLQDQQGLAEKAKKNYPKSTNPLDRYYDQLEIAFRVLSNRGGTTGDKKTQSDCYNALSSAFGLMQSFSEDVQDALS